jgi:serine/threonine protein kinase
MFKKSKDKKNERHESQHHTTDVTALRNKTLSKYEEEFVVMKKNSLFLREDNSRWVPKFGLDEVKVGNLLGVGGFCSVREVKDITLDPSLSHLQPEFQVKDVEFHETETRNYMAKSCIRQTAARYAVKKMKLKFDDEKQRCRGMLDLAIEAEYLSHLAHPNIIKMRGSLFCDSNVRDSEFCIVLDRLYDTLQEKIDSKWPKEYKSLTGPFAMIGKDRGKMRRLFLDRMIVAHDLSTAFRYLHSKRCV